MHDLKAKVSRDAPGATTLELYRDHAQGLWAFTAELRERRCRRTRNFHEGLAVTMQAFAPLFRAWTMEIVFALYMQGDLRFNGLKSRLGPVSSRVLSDKLEDLQREGLVARRVAGREVWYGLRPKGQAVARHLHPLLFFLHNADALPQALASSP